MQKKGKLELTWVGKYDEEKLEPRILLEDKTKSYGDPNTENMLIHGDNLIALKALEQDFAGKIKCIYIDPPYNTGSAFEHYEDGLEHSIWLTMMKERLVILRNLLRDDGFIFIEIDNNEMAYLKVLLDEIFGRDNFVNDIVWKRRGGSANPNNRLNNVTDYILWYSKSSNYDIAPIYSKDDDNTQAYIAERFTNEIDGKKYMLAPVERNAKLGLRETMRYEYKGYVPQWGWMMSKENLEKLDQDKRLHWNSKGRPNRRVFLEDYQGQPIGNLWTDIKVINPMSKERLDFDGQKPEALIQRIFLLTTNEGDWVLDSFLGTGTTAATAMKMKRKWIGIELREQCYSHCEPRLKSIIDGKDDGGITKSVNWQGGGGFKFYELAEPLLVKNKVLPVYQLNPNYTFDMVAEAICKIEGFKYSRIGEFHGYSSENRFIHVTIEFVNSKYIMSLMKSLGENQSLLIYCTKRQSNMNIPDNVEIKKIPKDLLEKCNFESEVEQ
jgi:adenine-specific DNA-methyltransferase